MTQYPASLTAQPKTWIDTRIDPVTAAVINGALENIAVEMGHKLMRMSYSSIIRESEDFGAALDRCRRPAALRMQDEHAAAIRPDSRLHTRAS